MFFVGQLPSKENGISPLGHLRRNSLQNNYLPQSRLLIIIREVEGGKRLGFMK